MRIRNVRSAALLWSAVLLVAGCKGSEPIVPTAVVVTPAGAQTLVSFNQTVQLAAEVHDQHGAVIPAQVITWSSSGTSVASVSGAGLVTAAGNGSAVITATAGTLTGTVNVTVAQAAASATKSGDAQSGTAGNMLALPITLSVLDAGGTPIAGAAVTFAVTSGGGQLSATSTLTSATGVASSTWTMGAAGNQTASATVGTVSQQFSATLVSSSVSVFLGNNQSALVGYPPNVKPAVRVVTSGNAPIANVPVTFAVASGGGSLTTTVVNTDANGVAAVPRWNVGPVAGANTLTATVSGAAGSPVTFSATGISSTFNITLQNVGPPFSAPVQLAFDSAIAFWQRAIIGDLTDVVGFSALAGQCGTGSPAVGPVTVDDVLILAKFDSIDGVNQILGSAGPCFVRTTGRLTIAGSMRFDTADVAGLINNGSLNAVIRHEMGHVLGFGTLWTQTAFNCLQNSSSVGNVLDTYFSCGKAQAAFDSIGGTSYTGGNKVPVENCGPTSPAGCGSGTVNSHWREPTFFNEMMTGYLNNGVANPGSLLTIAAMEDLAYQVNYGAAETYTRVFTAPPAMRASSTLIDLSGDVLRIPIRVVDSNGRVLQVIQP